MLCKFIMRIFSIQQTKWVLMYRRCFQNSRNVYRHCIIIIINQTLSSIINIFSILGIPCQFVTSTDPNKTSYDQFSYILHTWPNRCNFCAIISLLGAHSLGDKCRILVHPGIFGKVPGKVPRVSLCMMHYIFLDSNLFTNTATCKKTVSRVYTHCPMTG